jgi:hypothetical protein
VLPARAPKDVNVIRYQTLLRPPPSGPPLHGRGADDRRVIPNGVQLVPASQTRLKPDRELCLDMCRPVDMGLRYAEFAPIGHGHQTS